MGVPVMICHLAECLIDRALDCRWDATASEKLFKGAAVKEGAMRLGYIGDLRPLRFLSETVILFSTRKNRLCLILCCAYPVMCA